MTIRDQFITSIRGLKGDPDREMLQQRLYGLTKKLPPNPGPLDLDRGVLSYRAAAQALLYRGLWYARRYWTSPGLLLLLRRYPHESSGPAHLPPAAARGVAVWQSVGLDIEELRTMTLRDYRYRYSALWSEHAEAAGRFAAAKRSAQDAWVGEVDTRKGHAPLLPEGPGGSLMKFRSAEQMADDLAWGQALLATLERAQSGVAKAVARNEQYAQEIQQWHTDHPEAPEPGSM